MRGKRCDVTSDRGISPDESGLRCGEIVKDCDSDCNCVQYVMDVMGLAWGGVTGSGEMR